MRKHRCALALADNLSQCSCADRFALLFSLFAYRYCCHLYFWPWFLGLYVNNLTKLGNHLGLEDVCLIYVTSVFDMFAILPLLLLSSLLVLK